MGSVSQYITTECLLTKEGYVSVETQTVELGFNRVTLIVFIGIGEDYDDIIDDLAFNHVRSNLNGDIDHIEFNLFHVIVTGVTDDREESMSLFFSFSDGNKSVEFSIG